MNHLAEGQPPERDGRGFCSTLAQSLAAEGTQSSHVPTALGTFSEAAPRTGPVCFVEVEELLVGASFAGELDKALPPCPVRSCPFPLAGLMVPSDVSPL